MVTNLAFKGDINRLATEAPELRVNVWPRSTQLTSTDGQIEISTERGKSVLMTIGRFKEVATLVLAATGEPVTLLTTHEIECAAAAIGEMGDDHFNVEAAASIIAQKGGVR